MSGNGIPGVAFDAPFDPNDSIIATDKQLFQRPVTIASGQNLPKGRSIGFVTDTEDPASGKFVGSVKAATNGSKVIVGFLAEACDATGGDKQAMAVITGGVKLSKLTLGTGHTKDNAWLDLAGRGLFLYEDAAV